MRKLIIGKNNRKVFAMKNPYLGEYPDNDINTYFSRLKEIGFKKSELKIINNFDNKKVAKLLAKDEIVASVWVGLSLEQEL